MSEGFDKWVCSSEQTMVSLPRLFAGVFPRMAAISMGGFIFLGAYDQTRSLLLEMGRKSL